MLISVFIIVAGSMVFAVMVALAIRLIGRHIRSLETRHERGIMLAKYDFWSNLGTVSTALLSFETMIDAVWGTGSTANYTAHLPIAVTLLVLAASFTAFGSARRWHSWQLKKRTP